MTHTEQKSQYTDGAWYWVENEGWHDEPPKIAPAMYRADCDAWYSWEFSGISTEYLKVLEPCVRHEQAARRAQVVPRCSECEDTGVGVSHGYDCTSCYGELPAAPQPPAAQKDQP